MIGAAYAFVPKKGIGIAFCICGVPGSAVMVKVKAPSAIDPGKNLLGIAASLNNAAAIGYSANATTNNFYNQPFLYF